MSQLLTTIGSAIAAGIVSACIARQADISAWIQEIRDPDPPVIWYGVYRDTPNTNSPGRVLVEGLSMWEKNERFRGHASTLDNPSESWKLNGTFESDREYLLLRYQITQSTNFGAGTYVLKRDKTETNTYFGYWFGIDRTLKEVVCFPYVLSQYSPDQAKIKFEEYLNRPGILAGQISSNYLR